MVGTPSTNGGGTDLFISEPEPMEVGESNSGFAIYAAKNIWLATFSYPDQHTARRARP